MTSLRSFTEHRAAPDVSQRIVVVEAGRFFSLLYLNNNLHVLRHAEPRTPWYQLPARWRQQRAELLLKNGYYRFSGYSEIFRRYLLTAKESPVHS